MLTPKKSVRRFPALLFVLGSLLCLSCEQSPAEREYILGLRAQKGEAGNIDPLTCFNRAIQLDPAQPRYYRTRADLYFHRGAFREALDDANQAIALAPDWHYLYYERGHTRCQMRSFDEALRDFHRAIRGQPGNDQFYSGEALALLFLERPQEALRAIDKAISLGRSYHWRFQRAVLLTRMGRRDEALAEFARTEACTILQAGNRHERVFFDGEREFTRVQALSPEDLLRSWPRPPNIEYYTGGR